MRELGKKSLNGNIANCKYCDVKHTFKVCSGKCPKENEKEKTFGEKYYNETFGIIKTRLQG